MTVIHKTQFDSLLEMKDAGAIASSAAAQVDAADKILDLGLGLVEANLIIDVTALEVADGNEVYSIEWQLSNSATFAATVVVASVLRIGDSSVAFGSADNAVGRYIQPVNNEFNGTAYRYARLFTRIAGTVATGINYSAFLTPA